MPRPKKNKTVEVVEDHHQHCERPKWKLWVCLASEIKGVVDSHGFLDIKIFFKPEIKDHYLKGKGSGFGYYIANLCYNQSKGTFVQACDIAMLRKVIPSHFDEIINTLRLRYPSDMQGPVTNHHQFPKAYNPYGAASTTAGKEPAQ